MPVVHLCIPQLLQPLEEWNKGRNKDFLFEPIAPELCQLLSQFEVCEDSVNQGLEASLFNALGMTHIQDNQGYQDLPVAHYRYQTHGQPPSSKALLCADPIHLEAGMNDITLTNIIDDLTPSEVDEILEDLNKHFKQDKLAFIQGSNQHWYVSLPEAENIRTTPLNQVFRKNIANFQPHSEVRNWQIIQNESQMILHNSPINKQREMAGLPTINSLWFWGGGKIGEQSRKSSVVHVYCNKNAETSASTIAKAANCKSSILLDELPRFTAGKTLIILDQLFQPAVHDNLDFYQQELTAMDEDIIKPLRQAWQAGKVEILIDGCDGKILKPVKPKAWKFWANKPALLSALSTFPDLASK